MIHGIAGYFLERARFTRRLSLVTAVVSGVLLGAMLAARLPAIRQSLRIARFGYEGANQYVRRIELKQYAGAPAPLLDVGLVLPRSTRRGGETEARSDRAGHVPQTRTRFKGPGTSEQDLASRPIRLANVPVVQSEDLVIDRLVRPAYPVDAFERGIEGKVTLQALIDTAGKVIDVQLVTSTGERQLEVAAEQAVWQCRFRPYLVDGRVSQVYAILPFAFRIY